MFEIDFLPVGDGARSGDAIAMRFTRSDTGALVHVIIDGGYEDDGEALVEHFANLYGTRRVDLVILTHPDADHRGGVPTLLSNLDVGVLAAHDPVAHGGRAIPVAEKVTELRALATREGTQLIEPFTGTGGFGGALLIASPTEALYEQNLAEQLAREGGVAAAPSATREALQAEIARLSARVLPHLPVEVPFSDAGGDKPLNNTSTVIDLQFGEQRFLFTGDAGVPALDAAHQYLTAQGRAARPATMVQVAHHGSRHNASSDCLDRLLGPRTDERRGSALISISQAAAQDPRYPSPRVTNAYARRGYPCFANEGETMCLSGEGAAGRGWTPMAPLPPRDASIDNRD
ncbi:MAG: MBL fold metallo-hydrolase [Solirubrobacterales bacterium]